MPYSRAICTNDTTLYAPHNIGCYYRYERNAKLWGWPYSYDITGFLAEKIDHFDNLGLITTLGFLP